MNRNMSGSDLTTASRPSAGPRRVWGLAGLCLFLLSAGLQGCGVSPPPAAGVGPSDGRRLLALTWAGYRQRFLTSDGRVVRPLDGDDTVSEGQAYAMLRAVWMDDQPTFDRVYRWTEEHLSRRGTRGDPLLAWHWGRGSTGTWGVLDWAAASDADEDYALALLFAARRWGAPTSGLPDYDTQARKLLDAILAKETGRGPDGRLYLLPGDWREARLILNPSYFAPAWYRVFARATGDPRWEELIASSYHALDAIADRLGETRGVGLMPDWAMLMPDGAFGPAAGFSAVHSWDAFRAPWRVALDWVWFREPRARHYLVERLFPFLRQEWGRNGGRLFAEYTCDGRPLVSIESTAVYAGFLPAFQAAESPQAGEILERFRRAIHPDPSGAFFDVSNDYYLNNWAWFGLLLGEGLAANLW